MNEILKYYLEVKPPQVDGVVSVELTGTLGMGRDEDRQIETIIYKPEWKEGEEKEMLRWLQDDRSDSTEEEKKI
ncbi:uncharacterized protein JCM6883_006824, partial [Sporobolomyces salmoneus]|uniref:uncharacterized protein n=1 Tax=Sporobolomyces salmoneus TaxID=183962 RepID=UPI003178247C